MASWISRYEYVQLLLWVTRKGTAYTNDPQFFAGTGRKYSKQNCQLLKTRALLCVEKYFQVQDLIRS